MRIYLDHNASTAVDPRVLERFTAVEREHAANPASLHGAGRRASSIVEKARREIAHSLGVAGDQVFFVSGGTEANNMVVLGRGDPDLPVLLAPLEHPSIVRAAQQRGASWWSVTADGRAVVTGPASPVGLVALVHAQNELGTLQPLEDARELCTSLGVPLHVDASQGLGRVDLTDVMRLADTATLSPHKAGGLRGAGVLVSKQPHRLRPVMFGGSQEGGLRPGTVSPALAAATALAVQLATSEWPMRARLMQKARDTFADVVCSRGTGRELVSDPRLPNTSMLLFGGVDGRHLLPAFDMAGVEASQGSACSAGSPSPPPVLAAMGLDASDARRCVRFSFSHQTSVEQAACAGDIVARVVAQLRGARESSSR